MKSAITYLQGSRRWLPIARFTVHKLNLLPWLPARRHRRAAGESTISICSWKTFERVVTCIGEASFVGDGPRNGIVLGAGFICGKLIDAAPERGDAGIWNG